MPVRTVTKHQRRTKSGRKIEVKSYPQKFSKSRGKRNQTRLNPKKPVLDTFWLMDSKGHFTGRANREGSTSSRQHVIVGKDDTGIKQESKKIKRVFGRSKSSWKSNREKRKAVPFHIRMGSSPIR